MKKIGYLLLIFISLVSQSLFLSAQNNDIQTVIAPKVRFFPSSVFNYLDDPGRYFTIQLVNTTTETKQVFFTIDLNCDFSADNANYYVRTKKEFQPIQAITLAPGQTRFLNRADFDMVIGNLNSNAYETNVDRRQLVSQAFMLPEGQYRFCLTPYEWTGRPESNPRQLGVEVCTHFNICYSGSAPEFTTPINGFSAMNLNNSNPANNLLTSPRSTKESNRLIKNSEELRESPSSDNRSSSQYTVLPLQRQVVFSWVGVVSNCLSVSDFNYTLKIVEVHKNQNVQEAIEQNATLATASAGSRTTYIHDTVVNRHFRLQRGHVYAAQVQATPKSQIQSSVQLSNEGKSQVIAFVWGDGPIVQIIEQGETMTTQETDNRDQIAAEIRKPYFIGPGKDKTLIADLTGAAATEAAAVPAGAGSYVPGTPPYYQVAVADSLLVRWMPARSDSLLFVNYKAQLYEYVGGEIALSMNKQPLLTKDIKQQIPQHDLSLANHSAVILLDSLWHKELKEGYKYLLHLETQAAFSYRKTTIYTITDYIHNTPVMRDSVVHSVDFDDEDFVSDIVFAWGIDSSNLDEVLPPQVVYPVNLSNKPLDDNEWTEEEFPKVSKWEDFAFRWHQPSGVNYGDSVFYKLHIAEFPKGKKPNQIKEFKFYVKDSIATTEYMDTVLFDSLKTGKNYVVMVQAWIKQLTDSTPHYNIVNAGKSHNAAFQLQEPPKFEADQNGKLKCNPDALKNLSKVTITPSADSLARHNVRLMMGEFPLIVQRCVVDTAKNKDKGKDGGKDKGKDKGKDVGKDKGKEAGKDKGNVGSGGGAKGEAGKDKNGKDGKAKEEKKITYSGDGYIIWNPIGSDIDVRLKVHFDSIQINKDFQIIRGTAVSSVTDSSTYLAAMERDLSINDMQATVDDAIANIATSLGDNKNLKNYYNKFKGYFAGLKSKYGEEIAQKYGGLAGAFTEDNAATPVFTFPLCATDKKLTGSENIIFSINNMFFSPESALMNIWAIFGAHDDNAYVPFLANNICMDRNGFLGNAEKHLELYMARDYEFTLKDGYKMRFKKSSNFAKAEDGTLIVIDKGKFDYLVAEIQFDMDPNDVMGIAKDGTPQHAKVVKAGLRTKLRDWDDWIANIYMDPFTVKGAEHFTFVPTGKGIYYDHSNSETPKVVKFPKDYIVVQGLVPKEQIDKMEEKEKKEAQKKNQELKAAANKKWQGFYWDELSVFISDEVSNTFTDIDSLKPKMDSMVTYKYGINNTITDSVHYSYPGSRINFGARGLIIDSDGFTCDFFAQNLIRASTDKGGGWAFSLDTIGLKVVKNQYSESYLKGGFGIPLFSGGFRYNCSFGSDSLQFTIRPVKDTLDLDLWVAKVIFDTKSSHFRVKRIYKEERTRIDLTMNGKINIDFNKIGISINYSKIKFEGLGMRNYSEPKKDKNKKDEKPQKEEKPKTAEEQEAAEQAAALAQFHDFGFDIGTWSFASPQKTLGGTASNGAGEQVLLGVDEQGNLKKDNNEHSISAGGFTFSITKFKPIVGLDKKNLKLGFELGGQIKFATGGTDFGASTGFKLWGVVDPSNHFKVEDVKAELDQIKLDNLDFEVFKLSGQLDFYNKSKNMGDGFGGSLTVSFMGGVRLSMHAGFGKKNVGTKDEYSWWYLNGACKFSGGIPIGQVSITGFSGGFAYNMRCPSLTDDRYSAKNLLETAKTHTNQAVACSSGMEFTPSKDSWVANAGISLALTGAENTMNADGLVSLRIVNKHFSGIFIEANAYVLSKMDNNITPGNGKNNKSPLIRAKAIIGFETTNVYDYFRLSLAVKGELDLSKLLEGTSTTTLASSITALHKGTDLKDNNNLSILTQMANNETELSHNDSSGSREVKNSSKTDTDEENRPENVSFGMTINIPIDFELKHYKKNVEENGSWHEKGSTDWYFSIGKPNYSERVRIGANLNMIVCKAKADFTFYMQTGNAFAYQMPPLSKEVQEFFFGKTGGKKMDATGDEVNTSRRIPSTDWVKIDKGGGFVLGSTFSAQVDFNMFLYVSLKANLGFDVALLEVAGQGCPGYPQIGKNDFYGLGQIYAALDGEVGVGLNLGFWDGRIPLFSAGVGALLQGGGPNPAYCYGVLRFQVNLLDGLVKFSTSTDFKLGDVCVPGADDPLANVQLFQSVTPGFPKENDATQSTNYQSPLQVGAIVSNMPWDREVYLAGKDGASRKFLFTLIEKECSYKVQGANMGAAYQRFAKYSETQGSQKLKFVNDANESNMLRFETVEGGFVENKISTIYFTARAFEWRTRLKSADLNSVTNTSKADRPYYTTGADKGKQKNNNAYDVLDWYDPTFEVTGGKKPKKNVKEYKRDTTLYFTTTPLPNSLDGQVVFSWPYNGEKHFPNKEYLYSGNKPGAILYLHKWRADLLDYTELKNQGKVLKIFLLKPNNANPIECTYAYSSSALVPWIKVNLPSTEYGSSGYGPHKLRFIIVSKDSYAKAEAAANKAQAATKTLQEYQSRISDKTYQAAENAHKANVGGQSQGGAKNKYVKPKEDDIPTINIQNQMYEEIYDSKHTDGKDSMIYNRKILNDKYALCCAVGEVLYEWTWFTSYNYANYDDLFYGKFSKSGRTLDKLSQILTTATAKGSSSSSITITTTESASDAWMFLSYDPSDSKLYHTKSVLPPRFFFALDKNSGSELMTTHTKFFQHLLDMERDFKAVPLLKYNRVYTKEVKNNTWYLRFNANSTNVFKQNLQNVINKGFIISTAFSFKEITSRIKGGTTYTPCKGNGYHPTTIDVPVLLDFSCSNKIEPLSEDYFSTEKSNVKNIVETNACNWIITDKATPAIVSDIVRIRNFMQNMQQHAHAFDHRGASAKMTHINDYFIKNNKGEKARYSPSDFPYEIPEIYLINHWLTAFHGIQAGEESSYRTTSNDYLKFYDRSGAFVYNNELQLKDAVWSKYWWSAAAQCLDKQEDKEHKHGFNRDFYFDKGKNYYNIRTLNKNNGKAMWGTSISYSSVMGPWYDTNYGKKVTDKKLENKIVIYYLSSESANFETMLMNIAYDVKYEVGKNGGRIFYPNAKITPSNCYYQMNWSDNTALRDYMRKCTDLNALQSTNAHALGN